jgi:hypothetical protein
MLLRLLTQNLKRQDWTAVGIELLILTAGVFLGLQAENWNQNRQDRAEARLYAARLVEDFSAIRDRSVAALEELSREAEALSMLSDLATSNGSSDESRYSVAARELLTTGALPPQRPVSYINILESNNLRLFEDHTLVDSLIRCDNRIQEFGRNQAIRSEAIFDRGSVWIDFLIDSADLSVAEALERANRRSDEFRRGLALARTIGPIEEASFQSILECANDIVQRLTSQD